MDEKQRQTLVSLLTEAKEIVDEVFGSQGSSRVRDTILLHLFQQEYAKRLADVPGMHQFPHFDQARQTALALLREVMLGSPQRQDREWVWETYSYFVQRAREAAPAGPAPEAT